MTVRYRANRWRIVQASAPHTGSTVLVNILYGIFCGPGDQVAIGGGAGWRPTGSVRVLKTHRRKGWLRGRLGRRTLLITSVRPGHRSPFVSEDPRAVAVPYADLLGDEGAVAERVYDRIAAKVTGLPGREGAVERATQRLKRMNRRYEEIKDRPFTFVDRTYQIHGSHRGRWGRKR